MGTWELDLATDTSVRSLRHDQIFGYTTRQREWGSKNLFACMEPEDLTAAHQAFEDALRTGAFSLECRIRWPDTSLHWMSAQGGVAYDTHGKPVRLLGVNIDISHRKLLEEELHQSSQRIEAERLHVLKATMRTVQDIVSNARMGLYLFRTEVEGLASPNALAFFDET